MTLYDMLSNASRGLQILVLWEFSYDQNVLVYKGKIEDLASSKEIWKHMKCKVKYYQVMSNTLIIRIKKHFNVLIEDNKYLDNKVFLTEADISNLTNKEQL